MIPTVDYGSSIYGVLAYNNIKVEAGNAKLLWSQGIPKKPDGSLDVADCIDTFRYYSDLDTDVRKPVIHFTLNPSPLDTLTEDQLVHLAGEFMERMGYGGQPYMIYQHEDIARKHLHIVSVRVDETGRQIPYRYDLKRAIAHCREMEQRYGLHAPGESDTRARIGALRKVNYPAGEVKAQIKHTARILIEQYRFRSLPELNVLLGLYNINIAEVTGEVNGRQYHGLMYGTLDDAGKRVGTPLKSSRLGEVFGWKSLERRFGRNDEKLRDDPAIFDRTREAIDLAKAGSSSERSLVAWLKTAQIDAIFCRTEEGRIYGATFVDHNTRTVLNGSALGRDYSARAWEEWFTNPRPETEVEPATPYVPMPSHDTGQATESDTGPSLIEQTLMDGLDAFGTIFETEPPPYEYIDPTFRLIRKKKRKKFRRKLQDRFT